MYLSIFDLIHHGLVIGLQQPMTDQVTIKSVIVYQINGLVWSLTCTDFLNTVMMFFSIYTF